MHILEAAAITNLRKPKPYDYSCLEDSVARRSVFRLSAAIAVVVLAVLGLSFASSASGGVHYARAAESSGIRL